MPSMICFMHTKAQGGKELGARARESGIPHPHLDSPLEGEETPSVGKGKVKVIRRFDVR